MWRVQLGRDSVGGSDEKETLSRHSGIGICNFVGRTQREETAADTGVSQFDRGSHGAVLGQEPQFSSQYETGALLLV